MNTESEMHNIEYYANLNYNAILMKENKKFIFYLPDLSIIASGNTIENAFQNLEEEKRKYFKSMIDINAQHLIPTPALVKSNNYINKQKIIFYLINYVIIAMFLIFSLYFVNSKVNRFTQNIVTKSDEIRNTLDSKFNGLGTDIRLIADHFLFSDPHTSLSDKLLSLGDIFYRTKNEKKAEMVQAVINNKDNLLQFNSVCSLLSSAFDKSTTTTQYKTVFLADSFLSLTTEEITELLKMLKKHDTGISQLKAFCPSISDLTPGPDGDKLNIK